MAREGPRTVRINGEKRQSRQWLGSRWPLGVAATLAGLGGAYYVAVDRADYEAVERVTGQSGLERQLASAEIANLKEQEGRSESAAVRPLDSRLRSKTTPQQSPRPQAARPIEIAQQVGGAASATMPRGPRAGTILTELYRLSGIRHMPTGEETLTEEEEVALRELFTGLAALGEGAIPVIREFLASDEDRTFAGSSGSDAVSYPSLRAGLLDTLSMIGGREAEALLVETLASTSAPGEIGVLARILDWQAPGTYDAELLLGARRSLQVSAQAVVNARARPEAERERIDVSPVFEVLLTRGDVELLQDVMTEVEEEAPPWKVYAMIALANMPGGEGLSVLASMLSDADGRLERRNLFALQMLAQASLEHPHATDALLDVAYTHTDNIPPSDWRKLAWALQGHRYQLPGVLDLAGQGTVTHFPAFSESRQEVSIDSLNLYYAREVWHPATWDEELVRQRIYLIDELIAAEPPESAVAALERSRASILQSWSGS